MRRVLLANAVFLLLPTLVTAMQSDAKPGQNAPAKPNAQKMASDDVLAKLERGEIFFLDVREPRELAELGTFEGYVNIPLGQLEKRLNEVPKDKPIVTA